MIAVSIFWALLLGLLSINPEEPDNRRRSR